MANRILIVASLILIVTLSFSFNVPNEIMNFSLATVLLISEIIQFLKYKQRTKNKKPIVFNTYNWLGGWVMVGFAVYWFSDELFNAWNVIAIAGVITFGVLESLQNYKLLYELNKEGFRNLSSNILIPASDITGVDFDENQLAIHTTKYQNDLILKSSNLKSPTWDELTSELSNLVRDKS